MKGYYDGPNSLDVIQVSNRNDPNWRPDRDVVNPYIP